MAAVRQRCSSLHTAEVSLQRDLSDKRRVRRGSSGGPSPTKAWLLANAVTVDVFRPGRPEEVFLDADLFEGIPLKEFLVGFTESAAFAPPAVKVTKRDYDRRFLGHALNVPSICTRMQLSRPTPQGGRNRSGLAMFSSLTVSRFRRRSVGGKHDPSANR